MDKVAMDLVVTDLKNHRVPQSYHPAMYHDLQECMKKAMSGQPSIKCDFSKHDDPFIRNAILCNLGIHLTSASDDNEMPPGRESYWFTLDYRMRKH